MRRGYASGRVRVTYEDPAAPADNFEDGRNVDGFHLGVGAEFGLKSGVYVKLEYAYSNYGDYEYVDGMDSASLVWIAIRPLRVSASASNGH